jgi:hypothetical protein
MSGNYGWALPQGRLRHERDESRTSGAHDFAEFTQRGPAGERLGGKGVVHFA